MPHKDPAAAREWRRGWWKGATKARTDQNAAARRRRATINEFLRDHKVRVDCAVCGYRAHHAALEFHHERDKKLNLSFAKSLAQAKGEMEKCKVLCSNCHRIGHWAMRNDPCKPDIFALTYEPEEAGCVAK